MIPLSDDMAKRLHAFVKDHKPGQSVFGLGAPSISMKIKQFARKAGLPHIHAHSLRHKFATDLLEAGVDLKVVQALMGHENLNTTEVYLSLTDERLHDAIRKRDQHKNEARAGKSMIQTQPETSLYVETFHKQQIRESVKELMHQIDFPFIGDRMKDELTVNGDFPHEPVKREWFNGNIILEGLRSHLETGGYSKVIKDIDDFDKEDADNSVRCHQFIDLVRKEVEKKFQVTIPIIDNGEQGFTISFLQTVCADAIEQGRGTNHYRDFSYHVDGFSLKFGAYIIYAGAHGQDLKPFEDIHRRMRENCSRWKQPEDIANQIRRIGEIQTAIRQRLETFALLERVPGECHLCSTPKDTV